MDFNQATDPPLDSIEQVRFYLEELKSILVWDRVALLADEKYRNQIYLFFSNDGVSSARINLSKDEFEYCFEHLFCVKEIELRVIGEADFSSELLGSIEKIEEAWDRCYGQSVPLSANDYKDFLERIYSGIQKKGRAQAFTQETIKKVLFDSHGYCMFLGCGERLDIDSLTGFEGNYSYQAHNVASSENGPRGILYLSERLSNDPKNVLLLCDKHHRLVDKVAAADYGAVELYRMRCGHVEAAGRLLNGLRFSAIPVYTILWPVGDAKLAPPDYREVSECLSVNQLRVLGQRRDLSCNDDFLGRSPGRFFSNICDVICDARDSIISQTKSHDYTGAIFAIGPISALIGLGALLGNKGKFYPMLRSRDSGKWEWASKDPKKNCLTIEKDGSFESGSEASLMVSLTGCPAVMQDEVGRLGHPVIKISAVEYGNGSIPHPDNGLELRKLIHETLHNLHDKGFVKVHLFVCASNAASMYIGQGYDLNHPTVIVYDFVKSKISPVLRIDSLEGVVLIDGWM